MPPLSFYCLGVPPTAAAARFCDIVHLAQIQERKFVQIDYLIFSRNYAIIVIEREGENNE
jgi:hypothetical protein